MKELEKIKIHNTKSLKQVILAKIPPVNLRNKIKRWLLDKILPECFDDTPAQKLASLQKGEVIGNVVITTAFPEDEIDIGVKPMKPTIKSMLKELERYGEVDLYLTLIGWSCELQGNKWFGDCYFTFNVSTSIYLTKRAAISECLRIVRENLK